MGSSVSVSCHGDAQTQLFCAIREGDLHFTSLFLHKHPKLVNSALSLNSLPPLHYAASHGQPDVVRLLLQNGARINALNHRRQTPLMFACKNGRVACVDRLVEWGADVLIFDAPDGRTCLHYAAKGGHLDCLQRILDAAKSPTVAETWGFARFVNVRDGIGATPLHLAARYGNPAVVRVLLSNGALVCATTTRSGGIGAGFGSTPLHFAARGGSTECVKELLAWGADRMQRNSQGHSPCFIAEKFHNTTCAALLNPLTAEPLVWPSPWKFMSDLDPEAKTLLEVALAQANAAWEKRIISARSGSSAPGMSKQEAITAENESENSEEEQDLCCICFEHSCSIEVQHCGHQMCAGCTLALCCHNKPNPASSMSLAPACPFCRCSIAQLKRAKPKEKPEQQVDVEKEGSKDLIKPTAVSKSKKLGEGSSSSLIGLVGKGSFRLLSSARGSGRVIDMEWFKDSPSQEDACSF